VKLVPDTNVLLAAFLSRGACHDLLEHAQQHHQIVISAFILEEFRSKLAGKFGVPEPVIEAATLLLTSAAELVVPVSLAAQVCCDRDDDWILATAPAGSCCCLGTGDKDLLAIGEHAGCRILAPAAFWRFEADRAEDP
jgi:putative PIN family toxin of toxin-antitoxin system